MSRTRLELPMYGLIQHAPIVVRPQKGPDKVATWTLRATIHKRGGPWEWWWIHFPVPTVRPLYELIECPADCYRLCLGTTAGSGPDTYVDVAPLRVWLVEATEENPLTRRFSKWRHTWTFKPPTDLFSWSALEERDGDTDDGPDGGNDRHSGRGPDLPASPADTPDRGPVGKKRGPLGNRRARGGGERPAHP